MMENFTSRRVGPAVGWRGATRNEPVLAPVVTRHKLHWPLIKAASTELQVELIASGYEWTCPICRHLNHLIEILEWVRCAECHREWAVSEYHHAYD